MFGELKKLLQKDRKLRFILFSGLVLQWWFCITQSGFYHPDQHFQIIEFSSYQLGRDHGTNNLFEITHFVRPTLQVYLFSGFYKICNFLGLNNPFLQLTILRIIVGLCLFTVFNLIAIHYFKLGNKKILYWVLLLLNFTWILPYTRTLYSSEMVASVFFFGTLFLYLLKKDRTPGWFFLLLIGLLMGLAFCFRYQMGFAIAGLILWLCLVEKKIPHLLPIAVGFLLSLAFNLYLDFLFYGEWVLTPYNYFAVNIFSGRAAEFGNSSFLVYIALLAVAELAPPFSFILFYYGIRSYFRKFRDPYYMAVFFFILGHCLVGHKEERFLFPVFNVLPIIIGVGLQDLLNFYSKCKKWMALLIKGTVAISLVLNFILLGLLAITPYSQAVHFAHKLAKKYGHKAQTIYCYDRTPIETFSHTPEVFYQEGMGQLTLKKFYSPDSLIFLNGERVFIAADFNGIKTLRPLLDSLGYKPVTFSSGVLWRVNKLLDSKKIHTINDIWALYEKD